MHLPPGEQGRVGLGKAMNLISFRHRFPFNHISGTTAVKLSGTRSVSKLNVFIPLPIRKLETCLFFMRRLTEDQTEDKIVEQRYGFALRAASEGFWEWDLRSGVVRYSPRWQAILGEEPRESAGPLQDWLARVHPEDRPRLEAELKALAAGKSSGFQYEHRLRHRDGGWRWAEACGMADRIRGLCGGALADRTERRSCDPLTGLPNRLSFVERLEQRLGKARDQKAWDFAVVVINLERYRPIAESLGFAA